MPAHVEVCPLAPVSCPRQCDAPNLTRQCLDAHKRDCPNEPVPCVHAPLGCSHVAPRGQIDQHEQDIGIHFVALSKAFVQLQHAHLQLIDQTQEAFKQNLQILYIRFEERLQIHEGRLKVTEAKLETQAQLLQPLVVKAKQAEARAKAKAETKAKTEAEARAKAEAQAKAEQAEAQSQVSRVVSGSGKTTSYLQRF
eukprot:Em0020g333a